MRGFALAAVGGTLVLGTALVSFGGWAVVTVDNPPNHLVAGRPVELTFSVRQHGVRLLGGLKPGIEAKSGGRRAQGSAWALDEEGRYRGTITVADTGQWRITVLSGFGNSRTTLEPLRAISAGAPLPPAATPAARGRALFIAKGCVTCHVYRGLDADLSVDVGPELSGRRFPADYLARFLADPTIKPPTVANARMPDLGLTRADIGALVAFLNADARVATRRQ